MRDAAITVRMYNPGFGDCFLITVTDGLTPWRMLVDCGVHMHGRARRSSGASRPIGEIVSAVIAHLEDVSADGIPRLDVVVATHRHADHVSGFADDAWLRVEVGEVWVPFTEDETDSDARDLRRGIDEAADNLRYALDEASERGSSKRRATAALAMSFVANSGPNLGAMTRLISGGFAGEQHVRFLPDRDIERNHIPTPIEGVAISILGPSRDPHFLRRMEPSAGTRWFDRPTSNRLSPLPGPLFAPMFTLPKAPVAELDAGLRSAQASLRLNELNVGDEAILRAASLLERSVNNTSLFFVLEARGVRLVFVGDAQQGAWDHVLGDDRSRALVAGADFYKVGHHGSHNSTPREFVDGLLKADAIAMVPVGPVRAWEDIIPKRELLSALAEAHVHVIRADSPSGPSVDVGEDLIWSEVKFELPES